MLKTVRWGIVATGGIADVVTADLLALEGSEALAVSSRKLERAGEFATKHGIPRAYGSVAELVADPDVDVVYVATPHAQHRSAARLALEAGKHVLCEKPMTLTVEDTRELVELARERGLFLMEAVWTRFNPLIRQVRAAVADGEIGDVRSVRADFGFALPFEPEHRLWNLELGGGSLMDLGLYPVSIAQMLLGDPTTIQVTGSLAPSGVDAEAALLLGYESGAHALLTSTLTTSPGSCATVFGTKGRIDLHQPAHCPTRVVINDVERTAELEGSGYVPQLREVADRVRAGDTESPDMSWADSLSIARVLAEGVARLGVRYPQPDRDVTPPAAG
ncbi:MULTISPECIES: Gfo/Idh/MocA family protein [Actinosynnema]|uniref:Oxidoreductase n=1 Tax=Actinosynnema pretiosum TaxID=42197 RepID=A0A290YZZ9_9PSEU|nr:Gfo/Idh/MocA family oxidoreductase [Actinosynnema pretiosum]ATE52293.1 oxidoreductase [Actinosynnema pretiosum]